MSSTHIPVDWREDVVARGHGDDRPVSPGVERDAIEAVRFLATDTVERTGSSHPGTAMAAVASLPSWVRFRVLPTAERDRVPRPDLPRVSAQGDASQGWHELANVVGVHRFGLSATGPDALAEVGSTAEAVADAVAKTCAGYSR